MSSKRKVGRKTSSSGAPRPASRDRFRVSLFFVVSVAVHVGFAVGAAFLVVQNIQTKRKMAFLEGPPVVDPTHRAVEHKVSMVQKMKTGGAPPQARRIVSTGIGSITLPEMPRMPSAGLMTPSALPGMSGTGFGPGTGVGLAMSPGMGMGQGAGAAGGGFSFFGFRGATGSIVYVVDISGSMIQGTKDRTSYEKLEDEVVKSINALSPAMKFNLITFGSEAFVYQRTMVGATPMEKEKAVKWLKSYSPCLLLASGQSQGTDAIWVSMKGRRHNQTSSKLALNKAFEQGPDTIVFVSDGEPTDDQRDKVLWSVREHQETRAKRAVVNVFAYKADSGQFFMEKLAKDNGGKYTDIR
jgi:uncharacterized protein YegL